MGSTAIKRRLPVPALIGTAFGGLWSVLGAVALPQRWMVPTVVAGLLVTAVLLVERCRKSAAGSGLFRRRAYVVAVVLEVAGLYLAMWLLKRYGLESYFMQALGFVVGLHFIGLWLASDQRRYVWLCVCMCLVGPQLLAGGQRIGAHLGVHRGADEDDAAGGDRRAADGGRAPALRHEETVLLG